MVLARRFRTKRVYWGKILNTSRELSALATAAGKAAVRLVEDNGDAAAAVGPSIAVGSLGITMGSIGIAMGSIGIARRRRGIPRHAHKIE